MAQTQSDYFHSVGDYRNSVPWQPDTIELNAPPDFSPLASPGTSYSAVTMASTEDTGPMFYNGPPPAYSAGTGRNESPPETPDFTLNRDISSQMESAFFRREPGHMGGAREFNFEFSQALAARKRHRQSICRRVLMLSLVFLIILAFCFLLGTTLLERKTKKPVSYRDRGRELDLDYINYEGLYQEPRGLLLPKPACSVVPFSSTRSIHFNDISSFSFQHVQNPGFNTPSTVAGDQTAMGGRDGTTSKWAVRGKIVVVNGQANQANDIEIETKLQGTDSGFIHSTYFSSNQKGAMTMGAQYYQGNTNRLAECRLIFAIVSIRPGKSLQNLTIESEGLSVELAPNLSLRVNDTTTIRSWYGGIASSETESFYSRKIILHSTTDSIVGVYPLRDVLDVRTLTGAIRIGVTPKDAFEDDPKPAELLLETGTGGIAVNYPHTDSTKNNALNSTISYSLPIRDYRVYARTKTGGISGQFIHGTKSEFYGGTSSIRVAILPYLGAPSPFAPLTPSTLSTYTTTGTTKVNVLLPIDHAAQSFNDMSSSHETATGSITLRYPDTWEGSILSSSVTGSLSVEGSKVEIVERRREGLRQQLLAYSGRGNNSITTRTGTASTNVFIG